MTTPQAKFRASQMKHTRGHPEFVEDDVLREVSIRQVYTWVRQGHWRQQDWERWCSVLGIPLD